MTRTPGRHRATDPAMAYTAGGKHRAPKPQPRTHRRTPAVSLATLTLGVTAIVSAVAYGSSLQPRFDTQRPTAGTQVLTPSATAPATVGTTTGRATTEEGQPLTRWQSPGPSQGQGSRQTGSGAQTSTSPAPTPTSDPYRWNGGPTRAADDPTSSSATPSPESSVGLTPVPSPYPHPTRRHCWRNR